MTEQNPDFPLPNMPRMGRRNAIIANQDSVLSGGAQIGSSTSTPTSLLETSSNASIIENRVSIDPEGQIVHELANEVTKHVKIDMRSVKLTSLLESPATDDTSPITTFNASVLKEWKKLHESNSKIEGIQAILQEKSPVFTIPPKKEKKILSRAAKVKQARARSISSDKGNTEMKSAVTVKPWRNPADENPATSTVKRQKVFETFELTSVEPSETPNISESKLKKSFKEKKQKIVNQPSPSNSEESLLFPKNNAVKLDSNRSSGKDRYGGVQAKVDTRWNKWETITNWKLTSVFDKPSSNIDKHMIPYSPKAHWGDGPAKPNAATKTKTSTDSNSSPHTPKDSNKIPNNTKLAENHPASEALKNHPAEDRLPLTIGPQYNHKKAWRMINGVQSIRTEMIQERKRFHDSTTPSSYPYNNKVKYDSLIPNQIERQIRSPPTYSETSPFKSTFYNLQRINNGRIRAPNAASGGRGNVPTIGRRHSSLLNFDLVMRTKSPPVVTTIQAPPSPFLTSNISIYSQMNTIPINGEPIDPNLQTDNVNKANKGKDTANTVQRKEAKNNSVGKAPVVSKGNRQIVVGNSNALPSTRKYTPKRAETVVKNQRTSNKGGKDHSRQQPKLMMTGQPSAKVVRTTKKTSNKYSKIYIGPYSGSDSESEQQKFHF